MRMIDADALKDEVNKKQVVGRFNILNLIDNAPTVEIYNASERLQGIWLCDNRYLDCRCSICNSYALERGDYPELSPYCPQCGARMFLIRGAE